MALDLLYGLAPIANYIGKVSTDKWFTVLLTDRTDHQTGEPGIAFGSVSAAYSAVDGSDTFSAYTVNTEDWIEIGLGVYGLRIGASEFSAAGQYVVYVGDTGTAGHKFVFTVDVSAVTLDDLVRATTPTNTMDVDANGDVNVALLAANAVAVGSIAASAITASAIATDAIGSDEMAATATAEIADAVWDEAMSGHVVAGSSGDALGVDVPAILVNTAALNSRLTAGRATNLDKLDAVISTAQTAIDAIKVQTDKMNFGVANELDVNVESWNTTAVTTSATSALPEVDAKSVSDNTAAADAVQANIGNLDAAISTRSKPADSQVLDLTQAISEGQTARTIGGALEVSEANERNKIAIAAAVRTLYQSDGTTPLVSRTQSDTEIGP